MSSTLKEKLTNHLCINHCVQFRKVLAILFSSLIFVQYTHLKFMCEYYESCSPGFIFKNYCFDSFKPNMTHLVRTSNLMKD